MKKLHERAQDLADDAQNIADRLKEHEAESKDKIPLSAIQGDITHLCFEYTDLRKDLEIIK